MNNTMYYYEIVFVDNSSIAIRSLIPDMTIEEAQNFTNITDHMELLRKHGKVSLIFRISREEVHNYFNDENINQWPIAVKSDTLMKEYKKYQTQWLLDHGYTIQDLISELNLLQTSDPEDDELMSTPVAKLFEMWEQDIGFDSEIWACFDEWKEIEGSNFVNINGGK